MPKAALDKNDTGFIDPLEKELRKPVCEAVVGARFQDANNARADLSS